MTLSNTRAGILLMIATVVVFALQDAMSRHLAGTYNVWMVLMVRYWFFGAFVLALAARRPGGLAKAASTAYPRLQLLRGVLLAAEIAVMVTGFTLLGLAQSHAVFAMSPLLVAALSGPILGERVGWRRWSAIGIGFVGVMVILNPGAGVFDPAALVPFLAAVMFALYSLLTRYVARADSAETSFFWAGTVGAVLSTLVGVWFWEPMSLPDWGWMLLLCVCAVVAHGMLIKCYELAEASALQPFSYLQLVFASALGLLLFDEVLRPNLLVGAAIVVSAGLFTVIRTGIVERRGRSGGA